MTQKLYFVRCVATSTGTAAERNLKDYVRQFDCCMCNIDGWRQILWAIKDCNVEYNATHSRCTPTDVVFDHVGGSISLKMRNAEDNFRLLDFFPIGQFYLDKAVLKLVDGVEYACVEEEKK